MDIELYRGDLTAALLRIEQLEGELALYRADPAFERVDIAEEALARVRMRRERMQRLIPRFVIGSIALTAAFALTHPDLPDVVRSAGYALFIAGVLAAVASGAVWLTLGAPPKRLHELERQVRIAKGEVGARPMLPR